MPPCSGIRCASAGCCLTACSPQPDEGCRGPATELSVPSGRFETSRGKRLSRDWRTIPGHARTDHAALRSLGCNAGKHAPNGPSNGTHFGAHFASAPEKPQAPADLPVPPVVPSASSAAAQSSRRWQAGRRNYCLLANGNMSIWAVAGRQNALDHSIRSGTGSAAATAEG